VSRRGLLWLVAACLAAFGLVAAFITWSAPDTGPAGKRLQAGSVGCPVGWRAVWEHAYR
jgi:hypothetical protein